ncbi:hypothetical protein SteCoe_24347 [Stentor coeruleus]|uniref:non-specific serine/threonine protein kinase n=1 Tax=Stentor coeruleus TaxID=5963 RepID=A0A1R2BHW2_9CILI|nr:hypothetical protein SteCoe_24347 [Stentor coeruleus]
MGCGKARAIESRKKKSEIMAKSVPLSPGAFINKTHGHLSSKYEEIKNIGVGAFAEVHLYKYLPTNQNRAVKIIHKAGLHEQHMDTDNWLKEINILTSLDHPNILKCYEIFEDSLKFYVSMEYCPGGELFYKLIEMKKFTESQAAHIMTQILSAVCYCHNKNIIHRDLKPENILLDEDNGQLTIKIADFGSSSFLDKEKRLSGCFGSAYYVAPEVVYGDYDELCDIWSCGVIMFILLTGKPPYPGKDSKKILEMVVSDPLKIRPDKVPGVSSLAIDLLKSLLKINPRMRITAKKALEHPWIKYYDKNNDDSDLSLCLESLEQFNASSKLKDAVHIFIASQIISHEESKHLRKEFQAIDKNSDGKITRDELISKYKENMEESKAKQIVDNIIKQIDSNLNGEIDYSEFISACMNHSKYQSKESLEEAFRMFDKDGSGGITANEIKNVLDLNSKMPETVWEDVLAEADNNGDGVIDIKEFIAMMSKM